VRGRHCEERNPKSAIADFVKKRRSNPAASAAIVEPLPLDYFASLALTARWCCPSSVRLLEAERMDRVVAVDVLRRSDMRRVGWG
jgi:hypothetical protein